AVELRPHDRGVRPPQRARRPDPRAHRPGDWLVDATATASRLPVRDLSRRPRARQATTAGTSNAATRPAVLPPYCLEVPGLSIIARCPAASSYVHSDTQVTDRRVLWSGGGSRASPFRGWPGRLQLRLRHALPGERAEGRGGGLVVGGGVDGQLQPFERECAAMNDDTMEVRHVVDGVLAPRGVIRVMCAHRHPGGGIGL